MNKNPQLKKCLISIIIITLNAKDLLKRCLASINSDSTYDIEIILVDNGSIDGTTWATMSGEPLGITAPASTTTINGSFSLNSGGLTQVRVKMTA